MVLIDKAFISETAAIVVDGLDDVDFIDGDARVLLVVVVGAGSPDCEKKG